VKERRNIPIVDGAATLNPNMRRAAPRRAAQAIHVINMGRADGDAYRIESRMRWGRHPDGSEDRSVLPPSLSTPDADTEIEIVTLADLQAAAGVEPIPPGRSAGVVHGSDEEFLAHLRSQPHEPAPG
jgi:hypothetical protein